MASQKFFQCDRTPDLDRAANNWGELWSICEDKKKELHKLQFTECEPESKTMLAILRLKGDIEKLENEMIDIELEMDEIRRSGKEY